MIKSVLPHIGNKSKTLGLILPHIRLDTDVFIEPFCGSCAVTIGLLQSRPNTFKHIICADLNEDIILFWNLVQKYGCKFGDMLSNFFDKYSSQDLDTLEVTDLEERGIFYYIKARCSYHNCINSGLNLERLYKLSGGLTSVDLCRFDYFKELLKDVEFKAMGYQDSIKLALTYSSSVSAFIDPPYPLITAFSRGNYAFDFIDIVDLLENTLDLSNVVLTYSNDDFCTKICSRYGFTSNLVDLMSLVAVPRKELYLYK